MLGIRKGIRMRAKISIDREWHGAVLTDPRPATVDLTWTDRQLRLEIEAPYAYDPPPPGPPASLDGLWEHEVVELFLVEERSLDRTPRYLEIELSPHGHHLVLSFDGVRRRAGRHDPLSFEAEILSKRWRGVMTLDRRLAPPAPWRVNAFRIHGSGAARRHHAATPVRGDTPDFHNVHAYELRLE